MPIWMPSSPFGLFPTYSTTIFFMNLSWRNCSRVDLSHLRQKSTSQVRVESFEAVDLESSHFSYSTQVESQKIVTWLITTLCSTVLVIHLCVHKDFTKTSWWAHSLLISHGLSQISKITQLVLNMLALFKSDFICIKLHETFFFWKNSCN
jgi:hypothetical protein